MNQLVLAGIAAAVVAAGAFTAGWRVNGWRHDSQQAAIKEAAAEGAKAAGAAAVTAIEGLGVKYVPIWKAAEKVVVENVVYRECVHDPLGLQAVNAALAGGEQAAGAPGVPGADTPERRDVR